MPDSRVYSYKILQDADLSQNDLLNVRKINNDDYNVLIDSKNHVQIESVDPGSTNDAFVKVSPRTVDAKTTEGTGANESSSEVILKPGEIDVSSTTDIDVSTPELDIDASKVTVDTPEVINTVGSHYKTSVGDKSIEIKESNDSFILSHGDSSKVEINNGSIVETTPVAKIKSSDNITLDTSNFNIKDGDTPLVNIEKLSTNHEASVTLPLEDSSLNLEINGQIVTISESTDYEGNQASYQIEDLIEDESRTISGNFSVSVKSVSANEDDEQEHSYDERPENTFTIQSESGSEHGVRIEASETRITSTDSELKGSGYSPNVISVGNNDITLYTDENNGYIKLSQTQSDSGYDNSIYIKSDEINISSPGDIALESDTSAKIKSGDNYMKVTPSTGTIHIDDGTLEIDAEEFITSVSGKTQIKQTSDVGGIADSDKIEISVEKENTFNSSILLDKDEILEYSKNITLNSDTRTEVESNNTVYLSSKNGGNSTYNSKGVATEGNVISNTAGNSSETITSSGPNAGISRVSDSKDSSKVESGNDISEIEVLPASETLKVEGISTNESSQIGLKKDNISLSSCKNVIAEVTENSVSGTKGHIEIKKDSNKVKIESQANEVSLYSMSSNVLNDQNKLSLKDDGAVISIPTGSLEMTSNTRISSKVSHLDISLKKDSQGERITASASGDSKTSKVVLDKGSISSQSDAITSASATSTNIRSENILKIGKGSDNDNYSASSKYYSDGVIETIGTTISNTAGTGNEQSSETISKSEGISRSSNVKDYSLVGTSIMDIEPNSETFISKTIEMKVDSSVDPAGYIKLEKNNSGKSESTISSDTTEFTSSSKISSKVNNGNLEVSLIKEDTNNNNKDSITILAKDTNNSNSKITLDNENIKSEGKIITSKSVISTEVKSEGTLKIGKETNSSNYSVSSTYDSSGITNSATSLTISNSAANINSTADTLVDIKVKGSGNNDLPDNEIKIGNASRGIKLSSNDTISSESKNVEIKLEKVTENSNNHNASIKLNTSSNKTEAKISATDGVLIEAPAAGSSNINSDIKLDADNDIKLVADNDINITAANGALLKGTNVTISSDISSGKTTISGNELDVTSTTTKIEGYSTTISSSTSTKITSNKTDITSGTINIGDSTNPGTINIVGNNNLSIKTGLSKSEVQSDNLKFNETLSSNNIKIYWDSTNNALVFSKI